MIPQDESSDIQKPQVSRPISIFRRLSEKRETDQREGCPGHETITLSIVIVEIAKALYSFRRRVDLETLQNQIDTLSVATMRTCHWVRTCWIPNVVND